MTLDTRILFDTYVDPKEVHDWVNENLLKVSNPEIIEGEDHRSNKLGQGFDAWFMMNWNTDQSPIKFYSFDTFKEYREAHDPDGEWTAEQAREERKIFKEERDWYKGWPADGRLKLSFDTGYGYRGEFQGKVLTCTGLHALYIGQLHFLFCQPRGIKLYWQNEYDGSWHEGVEGIEEFIGHGKDAMEWFDEAFTAIKSSLEGAQEV